MCPICFFQVAEQFINFLQTSNIEMYHVRFSAFVDFRVRTKTVALLCRKKYIFSRMRLLIMIF